MDRNKKIEDLEIKSFLNVWNKNNDLTDEMRVRLNEMLEAFYANRVYVIRGADKASSFEMRMCSEKHMLKACKIIWDNPRDFWEFEDVDVDEDDDEDGADEYYEFLKFLWCEWPDGREMRLADVANADVFKDDNVEN